MAKCAKCGHDEYGHGIKIAVDTTVIQVDICEECDCESSPGSYTAS